MQRRFLLTMTTAAGAAGAIVLAAVLTGPAEGVRTDRVAAGESTDCTAAGVPAAGGTANAVTFDGSTVLVSPELQVGEKPMQMLGAVSSSPDGATVAKVVDAKGPDRLAVSTDAGVSWTDVVTGRDITYPAVSPTGKRIAFAVAGSLTTATAAGGWQPGAVALPGQGRQYAQYLRFVDENRLLMTIEVGVEGVAERFASLSDVWLHDLASGTWQRLTTTKPDAQAWSIAKTPIFDNDGSLLYMRHTGLGSGSDADLRTELRRVVGGVDSAVRQLPDRWGIVAVDAGGTILWNGPDERSQWQLTSDAGADKLTPMGCGRSSWAPSLNHDPDYTP